jgi:PKHD-type hydroxylase
MPQYLKYNRQLPQFKVIEKYYSEEEVDRIIDLEDLQEFSQGKVGTSKGELNTEARNSDISWLHPNPQSQWVFDKFGYLLGQVNHDAFMYDIDGFESFQYTKYNKEQHYDWHFDVHTEYLLWERKISAVIILSDPKEYSGGELEVMNIGSPEKTYCQRPNKGDVIFFASWMPHRVRPVKKGLRRSLVAWVMGKRTC